MKKITFLSIMLALAVAFVQCDPPKPPPPPPDEPPIDTLIRDGDGNVYTKIVVQGQTWLKENLKTTKYNDGSVIANIADNAAWASATSGGYCWYDNNVSNKNSYGALYNFPVVSSGKICPKGWHVPFNTEWRTLVNNTGKAATAGMYLKEEGTEHWSTSTGATNEYGFTALPNGQRTADRVKKKLRSLATFWTNSEYTQSEAEYVFMEDNANYAKQENAKKEHGFAIRCIKNE
jgi:uncharacterized protein (TIGR02145 family)